MDRRPSYIGYPLGGAVQRVQRSGGGAQPTNLLLSQETGSTQGDTIAESNLYHYQAPASLYAPRVVLRVAALVRYSCTGTPTLRFRLRTGEIGGLDLAADVTTTCRNNASGENMNLNFVTVLSTSVWDSAACTVAVWTTGTAVMYAGVQVQTGLTQPEFTHINLTCQWGVADPLNSCTAKAIALELLYPSGGIQ